MPSHKVSFVFGGAPPVGQLLAPTTTNTPYSWSESWYSSADLSDQQCLTNCLEVAGIPAPNPRQGIKFYRRMLMTRSWGVRFIRVTRWPPVRGGVKHTPQLGDQPGLYAQVGEFDEQPWTSLVYTITGASSRMRNASLRAISTAIVNPAGLYTPTGPFTDAFNAFANELLTGPNNWSLKLSTVVGTQQILGVVLSASTTPFVGSTAWPLIKHPAPALVMDPANVGPWTVRISGVIGITGLNGVWGVYASALGTDGFAYTLLRQKRNKTVNGAYIQGGVIANLRVTLDRIASVTPSTGGSHRAGGVFPRPRGRRKARV